MHNVFAIPLAPILLAASPISNERLPIGRVMWGQNRATGFMVDRCTMVTSRHVAVAKRVRVGASFRFAIFGVQRGAKVLAIGQGGDMRSPGSLRASDWLVARLDRCLDRETRFFELNELSIEHSALLHETSFAAGFPGRSGELETSEPCRLLSVGREGTIETDCVTEEGYSGGPLFLRHSGKLLAVGVVSAGDPTIPKMLAASASQISPSALLTRNRKATAIDPFRTRSSKMEETRSAFR